jgi:hypothetical protein
MWNRGIVIAMLELPTRGRDPDDFQSPRRLVMTRSNQVSMLAALALALVASCDTPTQGVAGNIEFTPIDCGRYVGCNFADSLGLGGTTNVYITGVGAFDATGVTLRSSDSEVLTVDFLGDVAGRPTWELYGASEGTARLIAIKDDMAVDSIEVPVKPVTDLVMKKILGDATGPLYDIAGYDEHWIVNAGERAVLHVSPMIGQNPVMGRYPYAIAFEDAGFEEFVNDPSGLSKGELDFSAPAGQYGLTFSNGRGSSVSLLIEVKPDTQ